MYRELCVGADGDFTLDCGRFQREAATRAAHMSSQPEAAEAIRSID